jgi:TetR/AcrR family transcriptional regulator, transcriptional repressor for nem operon
MAEGTKEKLTFEAMRLFAVKGYGATPIADILHASGANSGSLYYFFPTKQDLLLEVLRRYRDGIHRMLLDPVWAGIVDPIEKVFALLGAYRQAMVSTDCTYGCPIGSLALEIHEPDPPVRELLAENFSGWVRAVEGCFRDAGDRLPADLDRHALAVLTLTVMEGAVMQSRTHRNLETYDACVSMLRDHVARLEAAAKTATKPKGRGK